MSVLINYPDRNQTPSDASYLPLTRRREYLSVLDRIGDPVLKYSQELQVRYQPSDYFIKQVATDIIASAIISLVSSIQTCTTKDGQTFFTESEQKREIHVLEICRDNLVAHLPENVIARELYARIDALIFEWHNDFQLINPLVTVQPAFTLSLTDYEAVKQKATRMQSRDLACHDFAFYQLNEIHAFTYIFNPLIGSWPFDFFYHPIQFLASWDYQLVKEPQAGDLVVYCSTLGHQGKIKAKHWGIWTDDKRVLSKHGIGGVYKHPVDDVVISYGNFVYYFHKQNKSPLLIKFLNRVKRAELALTTFSNPAVLSPLTSKGCVDKMIILFKVITVSGILTKSLLGKNYQANLRKFVISQLKNLSLSFIESKAEALQKINQIILLSYNKVEILF